MSPETLRAMAVFVEVAKARSFTRAASALGLPKSTVSRRVVALEHDVGLRLLKRPTRKVELTDEGLAYFDRCRRILDDADVAHEALITSHSHPRGHLRVAATLDFGLRLVDQLSAFCDRYPELTLEFDFTSRRVDPLSETCDVAIYIGVPPDSGLTAHKLAEVPRFFFASPDYLRSKGEPATPADLSEHNCICEARFDGKGVETHWTLVSGEQRLVIAVNGRLSLNSIGMIRRVAAQAAGIASLPESLCRDEVSAGKLVRILRDWSAPTVPIYAF